MKTISREWLNIGAVNQTGSTFRTFSLGIVQPSVVVRKILSYL